MRRDHPDVFELPGVPALPAPADQVMAALDPLLTDARRARIDQVLANRTRSVIPVLDGLIDPHNVSAVLRSADAFGTQEVHVIEGTDEFIASTRVAQGTERWLDVVRHRDAVTCVTQLRKRGYRVYVASMDGELQPEDLDDHGPVAIVFGAEHDGVSQAVRDLADGTYAIPMRGFVESLNVSVASAITLYSATRNRRGDLTAQDQQALRARFMLLSVERADEIITEHIRRVSGA